MSETDYPDEPDRRAGCPHPRERYDLTGHQDTEAELTDAIHADRLHHGLDASVAGLDGGAQADQILVHRRPQRQDPLHQLLA